MQVEMAHVFQQSKYSVWSKENNRGRQDTQGECMRLCVCVHRKFNLSGCSWWGCTKASHAHLNFGSLEAVVWFHIQWTSAIVASTCEQWQARGSFDSTCFPPPQWKWKKVLTGGWVPFSLSKLKLVGSVRSVWGSLLLMRGLSEHQGITRFMPSSRFQSDFQKNITWPWVWIFSIYPNRNRIEAIPA